MKHIFVIDSLRGLASLMVCVFHFVCFTPIEIDSTVYDVFYFGEKGVQIFFVISGIVIPLSMYRANYKFQNFYSFFKKRVLRIEPPYLVALLVAIGVELFRYHVLGREFIVDLTIQNILLHIGYLVPFVESSSWFNSVFWTLAIEFQFYLFMACLAPLLFHKKVLYRAVFYLIIVLQTLGFESNELFPYWAPLFAIGCVYVSFKSTLIGKREFYICLVTLIILIAVKISIIDSILGLSVIVVVEEFGQYNSVLGKFLGKISYSLYLIHLPVVHKMTYELMKFSQNIYQTCILIIVGILVSIFVALIFYKLIEEPAKNLSKKVS